MENTVLTTCYGSSFEKSGIIYIKIIHWDCSSLLFCAFCYDNIVQNMEQLFDIKRLFRWDLFILLNHLIKGWRLYLPEEKEIRKRSSASLVGPIHESYGLLITDGEI